MEANRLYYAFDTAPGLWTWLSDPSLAGQVASIDAIRDDVVTAMTELATWSTDPSRSFRQAAVDEFLGSTSS